MSYWENKLKELEEEEKKKKKTVTTDSNDYWDKKLDELNNGSSSSSTVKAENIAPAKDDRKWFEKGAFSDGYQFGDVLKTAGSTLHDFTTDITAGILGIGEKAVDAGAYLVGGAADLFGADKFADKTKDFIAKDLYDEEKVAEYLTVTGIADKVNEALGGQGLFDEKNSVLGEKSDSLVQSGGQLLATAGLQMVGVPWYLTTGVTSFGSETENAFNQGATYGQAGLSAAISAGAEILTEKLSGGIKFGGKTLDDTLLRPLVNKISNKVGRTLVNLGIDAVGEGTEEVISQVFSNLGSALYREEKLGDILASEEAFDEYLESFIGGLALGGGSGSVKAASSIKTGRDYKSGLTDNEQKIVDKEIDDRISEAESDGKKLTGKEKAKIEEDVLSDLKKGYISTEKIESILGGDTYSEYQDTIKNEESAIEELKTLYKGEELDNAIKDILDNSKRTELKNKLSKEVADLTAKGKDTFLSESYNEATRRTQRFSAELSKYDTKQQETIRKAIESGVLNNTNRTHEFVDMVAKISADKGVLFDFTDNAKLKESGFAIEGKTVNGFVNENGVTVNIDSAKSLNSVVGHEITHVLEGTEFYNALQETVFEYAKTKGVYKDMLKNANDIYKNIEGYKGVDGFNAIKKEVVADIVGDYLFTDPDFINHLSGNRNVFQKIYDEIKYLCKVATAGSKEARELAKVQRAFEKAYQTYNKTVENTDNIEVEPDTVEVEPDTVEVEPDTVDIAPDTVEVEPDIVEVEPPNTQELQNESSDTEIDSGMTTTDGTKTSDSAAHDVTDESLEQEVDLNEKIRERDKLEAELEKLYKKIDAMTKKQAVSEMSFKRYRKYLDIRSKSFRLEDRLEDLDQLIGDYSMEEGNNTKYSLSDSDGTKLTNEQQKYFKDSKMRDDNGALKVMYHGSQNAGFHVFDPSMSDDGTSLFFVDRNDVAASYSGTSETYEAKTIKTAEDMNNFLAEIGYDEDYNVIERDGKFELIYDGDRVATSDTAQGIYEEFCWYEGVGEGDANYKVYLNLTNPLEIDAKGKNWNNISREFSEEIADQYASLTTEEKAALTDLAEWEDFQVFRDEILSVLENISDGKVGEESRDIASAVQKLGGNNINISNLFSIVSDNFSAESIKEFAVKQMNTRDYAKKAKAEGYDGVIFKNLHDNGGYSNGSEGASTVAIAFDSNQVKSVANQNPTGNKDIRYSISDGKDGKTPGKYNVYGKDVKYNKPVEKPKDYFENTESEKTVTKQEIDDLRKEANDIFDKMNAADQRGESSEELSRKHVEIYKKISMAEQQRTEYIQKALREGKREIDGFKVGISPDTANGKANIWITCPDGKIVRRTIGERIYPSEKRIFREISEMIMTEEKNAPKEADIAPPVETKPQTENNALYDIAPEAMPVGANDPEIEALEEQREEIKRQMNEADSVGDVGKVLSLHDEYLDLQKKLDGQRAQAREAEKMEAERIDSLIAEETRASDELTALEARLAEIEKKMLARDQEGNVSQEEVSKWFAEYEPLITRIQELRNRAKEPEAPYYGEQEDAMPNDPFEERDYKAVGDRKTKAYMYKNPEVQPFFQAEANAMLGELQRSTKGERFYNDQLYYDTNGERGFFGTKRDTSPDIAYLLDEGRGNGKGYTYEEIEKGLRSIIEGNGKENNACSKRIEFLLNERLLHGYRDLDGYDIPANADYVKLIQEKAITEYNDEARMKFFEVADDYAPPEEVAPIAPPAPTQTAASVSQPTATPTVQNQTAVPIAPPTPTATPNATQNTTPIAPPTPNAAQNTQPNVAPTAQNAQPNAQPQIATVKTTETPADKKKINAASWVRTHILDKFNVFERLSRETGNKEVIAKANQMHNAESRAQKLIGKGDKANGVKALVDIRKEVQNAKLEEPFFNYIYHQHNIDRMSIEDRAKQTIANLQGKFGHLRLDQIQAIAYKPITGQMTAQTVATKREAKQYLDALDAKNKPVFGDSVTADVSRQEVAKYEQAYPQFKAWAQDVYDYNNHLRKMLVDNGIISQETADLWQDMYPHYAPIRRSDKSGLAVNVPLNTNMTGVNAPIKRATGGNSDIENLFNTMAMRTEQTYSAIAKNRFGIELKDTLNTTVGKTKTTLDKVIDTLFQYDDLLKPSANGMPPSFTVFENGERVEFEITEEMYEALKPTSDILKYTNKVAHGASELLKKVLTEYNPVFTLTNAVKDAQDVLINSKHPVKTYMKIPQAVKEMISKGTYYAEYAENGGVREEYFDAEKKVFAKDKNLFMKTVGLPINAFSKANDFVEKIPRLAEYIASRESGASIDVAMLDSAQVTTNFAAGGDVTKFANRNGFTFLNASVQGFNQQIRNVKDAKANGLKGWVQLAAKFAVAGLPAVLLNSLLWDDDEEYAELSDYVKDNYYVVAKYGDGKFVRIPKGRTVAVIQNAFQQIGDSLTGNDELDLKRFLDLAVSNLAPSDPLNNNIIAPISQAITNKTWYGDELVPTRLQDVPDAEQYDESTDAISKWLGEKTNISPYKLNYLMDQYTGFVGDIFMPMMTPQTTSGAKGLGYFTAPLADKFTTDSVLKNQNVTDFYTKVDELTKSANSMYATNEDILKSKYMNSMSAEIGELYAQKREAQNSNLLKDRKYDLVRSIQRNIDILAKKSLGTFENVSISDGYAKVGDLHYHTNKDGAWEKVSDKQLDKQNKVTSGLGISASDYWSNKEEYDFAYDYPEKYSLAKTVGGYESFKTYSSELYDIKSDKDKNGKTITGSRKEKVIDYINNLDADYYTKIILFKSEYNADDTYNREIIEYLNNRADISYKEMEMILKELGFTVDSKGNIYWD